MPHGKNANIFSFLIVCNFVSALKKEMCVECTTAERRIKKSWQTQNNISHQCTSGFWGRRPECGTLTHNSKQNHNWPWSYKSWLLYFLRNSQNDMLVFQERTWWWWRRRDSVLRLLHQQHHFCSLSSSHDLTNNSTIRLNRSAAFNSNQHGNRSLTSSSPLIQKSNSTSLVI